ncbi:MAG: NAD(P)-dependent oxidoreductase [Methylococcaceae bacterium]|nr:NAD(P)-dependent oxidoreductase [Methylococcaceae bacterium]
MNTLKAKTLVITGASRGIGKAIALRAAVDGANVAILAKSSKPHPKLPGTIFSAAEEIRAAGGQALPLCVDIRDSEAVEQAVRETLVTFGGIDILVNNASAISLSGTLDTDIKRYDLMQQINTRGTFLCSKTCIPALRKAENPHILNLSPPLNIHERHFAPHTAYSIAKYGMSLCVLGMAAEFREDGIAVNALWPGTIINTAAIRNLFGDNRVRGTRKPRIVADAAHWILTRNSREYTGLFLIDEEVLREAGETDFERYRVDPDAELIPDIFL